MASFKQNDKGFWFFIIDVGIEERKQKTFSKDDKGRKFETESQARRYAMKIEDDVAKGRKFENLKLKDYLMKYVEEVVVEEVGEITYDTDHRNARLHIIPYLGEKNVDKITDDDIENLYKKLLRDGRSRSIIAQVKRVLSKFFKYAMKKRKIIDNPMKLVTTPSYKPSPNAVWTPEQIEKFLESNEGGKFYNLYIVAESTGMRRGELLSLKWADVDLDNATVTINKSLKYSSKSKKHVKGPKTENSRRTISIPQYAVDAFRNQKENQIVPTDIVFDNFGEYWSGSYVSDEFNRDRLKSGLPKNTLHGLRHAHATWLLTNGFSLASVAARLGDTKETIMKTYAHVLPNTQNEIASALDKRKVVDKKTVDKK